MNKSSFLFFLFISLNIYHSNAQTYCGAVELILEEQGNNEFIFDNFSSYQGGFPRKTIARLKVRVADKAIPDNRCSWNLQLRLDNDGAPSDEMEELNLYGDGLGQNPLLSILEIRAINDCMTSDNFSNFVPLLDVSNIPELIPMLATSPPLATDVIPANSCTSNVNGPGDYISNYSEYTFKIELRIKPGMTYNPGTFGLTFNFRLEENI